MNNGNSFTNNFREAFQALAPIPQSSQSKRSVIEIPTDGSVSASTRDANDPYLNADNDPLAVIQNPASGRYVMRSPQDFSDDIKAFLPEILMNAVAVDKTDGGDSLLIDVDGIINNLKRIRGTGYNRNYIPGGANGSGWTRLPYPAGSIARRRRLPYPAGSTPSFEELYRRNGGR